MQQEAAMAPMEPGIAHPGGPRVRGVAIIVVDVGFQSGDHRWTEAPAMLPLHVHNNPIADELQMMVAPKLTEGSLVERALPICHLNEPEGVDPGPSDIPVGQDLCGCLEAIKGEGREYHAVAS